MKFQLICVDIDGTLLDDQKKLLPPVKESLHRAATQGIRIALVSGRMPAGVSLIEKELGLPCIKVCNAGAYILFNGQCIFARQILPDTMKGIYREIAMKYQVPLWIFRQEKWFVTGVDCFIRREMEIIQYHPEVVDAQTLADRWEQEQSGPNKLLIAAAPHQIQEIYQDMRERGWADIDMARSADTFLEIFPRGVTKGTALEAVCRKLELDPKQTMAFGDHELDLPMIQAAGVGVAMGNAIEELKEKADFVTKTNNEAGIAFALAHYLK